MSLRHVMFVAALLSASAVLSGCGGRSMGDEFSRSTSDCAKSLASVRDARAEVAEIRSNEGLLSSFVPRRMTKNGRALRRAELQLSLLERDYRNGCA